MMLLLDKRDRTIRIGCFEFELRVSPYNDFLCQKDCMVSWLHPDLSHMRGYYFHIGKLEFTIRWDSHTCYE